MLQNAAFTYDDYVDFLTTYLSLVHVITPDDLVGTKGFVMKEEDSRWSLYEPSRELQRKKKKKDERRLKRSTRLWTKDEKRTNESSL